VNRIDKRNVLQLI